MRTELIGKRVIGHWGAMHPESFGKITSVYKKGVFIKWDDMGQSYKEYDELRYDYGKTNKTPIGVYVQDES